MINNVSLPICVDLDGTLVREDTLWVLLRRLVKEHPAHLFWLIGLFLIKGRATFKKVLARKISFDPATLAYHQEFLDDLLLAFRQKKMLVLATGADLQVAQKIADHLGIFQMVLASDGYQNLVGKTKATVLANTFGANKFVYAGNSWKDVPVWALSAHVIVVNAPPKLAQFMKKKNTKQLKIY